MTISRLITQAHTKRVTAAALADAKRRRDWSNSDLGDALGCAEGTVRNRLEGDDPKHQMTVHELRRSIVADGPEIACAILFDVDHKVVPMVCADSVTAIAAAGSAARCAADLITAAADGKIDKDEARALLPGVLSAQADFMRLETMLREIIGGLPAG